MKNLPYDIYGDGVARLDLTKARKDPKFQESVRKLAEYGKYLKQTGQIK